MLAERDNQEIAQAYELAGKLYAKLEVDTEAALQALARIPVSVHCWQGDDVTGFEVRTESVDGGGIMATGNYPGPARTPAELRADAAKAFSLIPGELRFNLHANYAETAGVPVERDQLTPEHFTGWIKWAKDNGISLDFNPTFFAHPLANSGFTLSNADEEVRGFWVKHAIACRHIAAEMGRAQGNPCVINHWIPDGSKDQPVDRWGPRARLIKSLDEILAEPVDRQYCKDVVECKLFGIGSEDYMVGSHEFYMAYALTRDVLLCLDMGHFHPTEKINDKLSSILSFKDEILLHVSRGIRWDSDHVVILNDDVKNVFHELVRGGALERTLVALDFFDASINRIGAWVIGTRATIKAMLYALLEPTEMLQQMENDGNLAGKLGMLEEMKTMPFGAVWDEYCRRNQVPVGPAWMNEMQAYDRDVIRKR